MFGRSIAEAPPLSYRQELWIFLGFLMQPLVAASCGFLIFLVVVDNGQSFAPSNSTLSGPVWAARAFGLAAGIYALFVTPLAALPLFVWLRHRGPITLGRTLISGAALGNLLTVPLFLMSIARGPSSNSPVNVFGPIVGAVLGVACAAAFWLIAGRGLQVVAPRDSPP
jgi:hypothetical protein